MTEEVQYTPIGDVRCPVCKGEISNKWFDFRNGNTVVFIAECWTRENPKAPRHIFYFQIRTPLGVIVE